MNNLVKVSCKCPLCQVDNKKQYNDRVSKANTNVVIPEGYQNYNVKLDKNNYSLCILTNAGYKDAYYFITKWFLEERYKGNYENLDSLLKDNGYDVILNGNITENSIQIDLNRVRFN